MQQTLIKINKCIQAISLSLRDNELSKQVKTMENLVSKLHKQYQFPYFYFLSQVLAIRMGKFQQAHDLLQSINDRQIKQIFVNCQIRKAYFFFIQSRYSLAYVSLQQAMKVATTDPQLFLFASIFFSRIVNGDNGSAHKLMVASISAQINDNLKQAFQFEVSLYMSLKKEDNQKTSQLLYFTAKRLVDLNMGQINRQHSGVIKQATSMKDRFQSKHPKSNYQYTSRIDFLTQIFKVSRGRVKNAEKEYDLRQLETMAKLKLDRIIDEAQRKDPLLKAQLQSVYQVVQFKATTEDKKRQKNVLLKGFLSEQLARKVPPTFDVSSFPIRHVDSESGYESPSKNQKMFTGSYMVKIHATSEGQEKRYFYLKHDQFKIEKYRLYYKNKQKSEDDQDKYYSLKGLIRVEEGKTSEQLKRKTCQKFEEDQCFSLFFQKQTKSFYVPSRRDYSQWMEVLKKFKSNLNLSKMKQSQPGFVDSIAKTTLKKTKFAM